MLSRVFSVLLVTATATVCVASCDGYTQLRATLNRNEGGLADALRECISPLLFAPLQWLPDGQVREYCDQKTCLEAVQQMKKLPACTWVSEIPSGSDANTLAIAMQVMRDCKTSV